MKKRTWYIGACLLLTCFMNVDGYSQVSRMRRFHTGISVGFGLPKMPYSHFRMPVSVEGGAALNFRFANKWLIQVDGYGLHTFNLGSASDLEGELRFDLAWVSFELMRSMRGFLRDENFIVAGIGRYHLSQQFDNDKDNLNTMGISLGVADWRHWQRWSMVSEIRWHLLFDPDPKPQVLTVTFGILL